MLYYLHHGTYMHFTDTTIADVMHFTYLLHGAESFLTTNRFTTSQEIPLILWDPKVYYCTYKCSPAVPILRTTRHCQYLMYKLH